MSSSALTTPEILFSELLSNEIIFLAGDWSNNTISPIISSFPFNLDNESRLSSPKKISDSIDAAFREGWSESKDFLVSSASLKEVRTFCRDVFEKINLPQEQKDELVLAIAEAMEGIPEPRLLEIGSL